MSKYGIDKYKHIIENNLELDKLYASLFIRRFAFTILTLFIPVFLYNLGYSVEFILLYYTIENLLFVIVAYPLAQIIERIGPIRGLLLSFPSHCLFFYLLGLADTYPSMILLSLAVSPIGNALSNISIHELFFYDVDADEEGKEVSMKASISTLIGLIGPLIGGIIADVDFNTLFLIGSLTFLVAGIPLLNMKKPKRTKTRNLLKKIISKLQINERVKSLTGYAISIEIDKTIWPIFLLLIVGTTTKIGITMTLAAVVSLIITYFLGILLDDEGNTYYTVLNYLYTASYIARIFSFNQVTATVTEAFKKIAYKPLYIAWDTEMVKYGEKQEVFPYIVSREIIYNLARSIIVPFFILIYYLTNSLHLLLLLGGGFTILFKRFKADN